MPLHLLQRSQEPPLPFLEPRSTYLCITVTIIYHLWLLVQKQGLKEHFRCAGFPTPQMTFSTEQMTLKPYQKLLLNLTDVPKHFDKYKTKLNLGHTRRIMNIGILASMRILVTCTSNFQWQQIRQSHLSGSSFGTAAYLPTISANNFVVGICLQLCRSCLRFPSALVFAQLMSQVFSFLILPVCPLFTAEYIF